MRWDDRTWLKPESLQPVGAFKMRGAYNAVASLTDEERARGVVTYSSGNHAQAVARAARLLGAHAVIVMPEDAPPVKVAGVRRDEAEVVFAGLTGEERHAVALELVARDGRVMIEPYDDRRIIAGQGTCGLEIAEDLPGVTSVLIPVSGGGLSAGIADRHQGAGPERPGDRGRAGAGRRRARVAGEGRDRPLGRVAHHPDHGRRAARREARLAAVPPPAPLHGRDRHGHRGADGRRDAPARLAGRLVVEASGAAGMAAHLSGAAPQPEGDDQRVMVISGGNVDPVAFAEILRG